MKNWKRVLSLAFALVLCLSSTAYAAEEAEPLPEIPGFVLLIFQLYQTALRSFSNHTHGVG